MTATYEIERRLRTSTWGLRPLDYDVGVVPGQIVLHLLHLPDLGSAEETAAGLALRWGYGSAFGTAHVVLRQMWKEPTATLAFGSLLLGATLSMFPVLGHTPPPWRWPWQVMATCLVTHGVYVLVGAVVDDRVAAVQGVVIRPRPGPV
jgi:uncharacterized membrane protein YagU involved in acid resistance